MAGQRRSVATPIFSNMVGELAVRMAHVELFAGTVISSASVSIVEIARFEWGALTLRRSFDPAARTSSYFLIVQDEKNATLRRETVARETVASAIHDDISPIAALLLADKATFDWILSSFYPSSLAPSLKRKLLSHSALKATKKGRGPLRM